MKAGKNTEIVMELSKTAGDVYFDQDEDLVFDKNILYQDFNNR